MPGQLQATTSEQRREAQENQQAHNARGGVRDRLVEIGEANHLAGRGDGRTRDQ